MGDTNISNTVYILLFLCSDKSGYVYAISFSLNGLFNSMLCFFFFRRAILCCKGNERTLSEIDTSSSSSNQNYEELLSKNGTESEE